MHKTHPMPLRELSANYIRFINAWNIDENGIFVPPENDKRGVYVWAGQYILEKTVSIVADEADIERLGDFTDRELANVPISVGVISRTMYEESASEGLSFTEFCANNSSFVVYGGLKSAIQTLNRLTGLPNGRKLGLGADIRY